MINYGELQSFIRLGKKNKFFICKPESGCQGKGIYLTKNIKELKPYDHLICQVYISKPFLIDGLKFDLRIYVLVTSCDPLRIYVYKDGFARFATEKYVKPTQQNLGKIFMHLTNYAINKHSGDFINNCETGSKRNFKSIERWWLDHGFDPTEIWSSIDDVIIKTLITANSVLKHNYRTCFPNHHYGRACFEILGFDVMLDHLLKVYLLEVNHSPSFHIDAKIDRDIKESLIYDTFNLINLHSLSRKKCLEEEKHRIQSRIFRTSFSKDREKETVDPNRALELDRYEDEHLGQFRKIFPTEENLKYEPFFEHNSTVYNETTASKAREECTRKQLEEFKTKHTTNFPVKSKLKKDYLLPESPNIKIKKKVNQRIRKKQSHSCPETVFHSRQSPIEMVDSSQPMPIFEIEEENRIKEMKARDRYIRSLGIVELVEHLLNSESVNTSAKSSLEQIKNCENNKCVGPAKEKSILNNVYDLSLSWPESLCQERKSISHPNAGSTSSSSSTNYNKLLGRWSISGLSNQSNYFKSLPLQVNDIQLSAKDHAKADFSLISVPFPISQRRPNNILNSQRSLMHNIQKSKHTK